MYILNEKEYIRKVLVSDKKPEDLSLGYLIALIAKYYYDNEKSLDDLINTVKQKLLDFKLAGYQEYRYANKIQKTCSDIYNDPEKSKLKELECIPIYESEITTISSLPNDRQKKFLFTLYVLARYMNTDGWINKKDSKSLSEVFRLANISLTNDKKNELLYEMRNSGYIRFGKKVNNLNIQVELVPEGEIVYKLKDFTNIGNQYIGNFKKGYKQCKKCGKKIKDTAKNKLYCSDCAKEVDKNKAKERMKTLRNAKMFEAAKAENP